MKRHEQWFREAWTEKVPSPLEMTDKEILDWMDEYCESAELVGSDWKLEEMGFSVRANLLRDAAKLAAAYHKEANT